MLVWLALTLLIGLRHDVGGDWGNYLRIFNRWSYQPLSYAFDAGDPGYFMLNWLSFQLGFDIYGVNLVAGAVFATGLIVFCRYQARPWLALLVAIPYLVIVVAMGYTRQAIAIGFAMIAIVALWKGNNLRFVAWILIGALFHKSAVVLLPLAMFVSRRGRWWTAIWIGSTLVLIYFVWVADTVDAYTRAYIDSEMESEGAAVRVAMNALPAAMFLLFSRRLPLNDHARRLWTWISLMALAMVVLLVVTPASTAVDRIGLYLIPLQLFVFSMLPDIARGHRQTRNLLIFGTVIYAALTQAVWLNFAAHAHRWVPYQFYPLAG